MWTALHDNRTPYTGEGLAVPRTRSTGSYNRSHDRPTGLPAASFGARRSEPPVAVEASGSTIRDADGRAYIDAAGGAIVVNVGHGRASVAAVMAEQAGRLAFVHELGVHDGACRDVRRGSRCGPAGRRPGDLPGVGRVGGDRDRSQTRRAYHLARGETERDVVIARHGSYHGNTLGALHLSGRPPLRRPYEAVAGPVPARLSRVPVPRW